MFIGRAPIAVHTSSGKIETTKSGIGYLLVHPYSHGRQIDKKKRSKIIGVCCHSNFLMICIQYSSSTYEIYIRTRTRRAHGTCCDETVASICSSGSEVRLCVSWGLVQARKHDVRATRLHMFHRPHANTRAKIDVRKQMKTHIIFPALTILAFGLKNASACLLRCTSRVKAAQKKTLTSIIFEFKLG